MAVPGTLESLWKSGRTGCLSPLEQLRAVAFRDAYKELGGVPQAGGQPALLGSIAEKLTRIGGGYPSKEAVRLLFERIDEDPAWYPGKRYQAGFGPAPALNRAKRLCIAKSAMAAKADDEEPTYNSVIANCPKARRVNCRSPQARCFLQGGVWFLGGRPGGGGHGPGHRDLERTSRPRLGGRRAQGSRTDPYPRG
jgi:hypothetical protein